MKVCTECQTENKPNIANDSIQVVPSGPDIKNDALYEALIGMIHCLLVFKYIECIQYIFS